MNPHLKLLKRAKIEAATIEELEKVLNYIRQNTNPYANTTSISYPFNQGIGCNIQIFNPKPFTYSYNVPDHEINMMML